MNDTITLFIPEDWKFEGAHSLENIIIKTSGLLSELEKRAEITERSNDFDERIDSVYRRYTVHDVTDGSDTGLDNIIPNWTEHILEAGHTYKIVKVEKHKPNEELKDDLTDEQYRITQESGTEPPNTNEYDLETRKGVYVDRVSGKPLFISTDKFQAGCGWPAFSRPISTAEIQEHADPSTGYMRIDVGTSDGHLGHVFRNDKHSPNGVRYCINSAALEFVPYDELDKKGLGKCKKLFDKAK